MVSSFPDHVWNVVDRRLMEIQSAHGALDELEKCCNQMLDVGFMCTDENPQKRPAMSFVVQKLKTIMKNSNII